MHLRLFCERFIYWSAPMFLCSFIIGALQMSYDDDDDDDDDMKY